MNKAFTKVNGFERNGGKNRSRTKPEHNDRNCSRRPPQRIHAKYGFDFTEFFVIMATEIFVFITAYCLEKPPMKGRRITPREKPARSAAPEQHPVCLTKEDVCSEILCMCTKRQTSRMP